MIRERIAKLISVKSIITIVMIGLFAICALTRDTIPDEVNNLVMIVVSFYFGSQSTSYDLKSERDKLKAKIDELEHREDVNSHE